MQIPELAAHENANGGNSRDLLNSSQLLHEHRARETDLYIVVNSKTVTSDTTLISKMIRTHLAQLQPILPCLFTTCLLTYLISSNIISTSCCSSSSSFLRTSAWTWRQWTLLQHEIGELLETGELELKPVIKCSTKQNGNGTSKHFRDVGDRHLNLICCSSRALYDQLHIPGA